MKTKVGNARYWFAFAVAILCFSGTLKAQNSLTWDLLGTKTVDYAIDRDVITANQAKTYNALRVKVNNGTVNVHKVTIHFANGDTQDVKLPDELTKSNDGGIIDLKGNQRAIEKITFWYDTKNSDKNKAVVEVWARK